MKEQIDEMAKIFCGMKNGCDGCMWDKTYCNERSYAEEIYNAGYCKQERISIDDKLPEESGVYLAYTDNGNRMTLVYSAEHKLFNAFDGYPRDVAERYAIAVTHWMPLPEQPKMKGGAE